MDYIYFNHKGLENSNEDNLQLLLNEIIDKINICENNDISIGFYKEIFNIPLINFNNNFINHINKDGSYKEFVMFMMVCMCKNLVYPSVNNENIYRESKDFKQWFLDVCIEDNISSFISLSNDILFNEDSYINSGKEILNFTNEEKLTSFFQSRTKNYNSITEVFNNIIDKYSDKITILQSARNSSTQIPSSCKAYNAIYCAMEALVTIILPTNNNTLTKEISENYYQNTSLKISKESQKTLNLPRLKSFRTFSIDGRPYLFSNHVKIGNDIRIHYYILDNKLYIGHCGKHLPTATSRS